MEVLYPRCAGLDVHARSVTACVRIAVDATITYDHYTAATTTRGLLALDAWLTAHGYTHVAMEATGVYWKPVWHVLAGHVALVLGNAKEIKNVPGRKPEPAKFVISPNAPVQQIWVSARSRSFKLAWSDDAGTFVLDGEQLDTLVERLAQQQLASS